MVVRVNGVELQFDIRVSQHLKFDTSQLTASRLSRHAVDVRVILFTPYYQDRYKL